MCCCGYSCDECTVVVVDVCIVVVADVLLLQMYYCCCRCVYCCCRCIVVTDVVADDVVKCVVVATYYTSSLKHVIIALFLYVACACVCQ